MEEEDIEEDLEMEMVMELQQLKPLVGKKKKEEKEGNRADNFLGEGGWGFQTQHLIRPFSLLSAFQNDS